MSDEIGEYIFYRDNPKWKDVQPIPQDDGPTPIVRIAYSERCTLSDIVKKAPYCIRSFFLLCFSRGCVRVHESRDQVRREE